MSFRAFLLFLLFGFLPLAPEARAAAAPGDRLEDGERAIYQQAFDLAKRSDYSAARTTAQQGRQALLNRFFLWLDLIHVEDDEPPRDGFAELAGFLEANPGWPRLRAVQRQAEALLPAGFSDRQVIDWFADRPPLSLAGAERLIASLHATGRSDEALELTRRTWTTARFSRAQEAAFLSRSGEALQQGDHLARFERLMVGREFTAAARQAARLGGGYPKLAKARQRLALNRPGVDAAIARVPPSLQDDPGLLYERARWRQRRGRLDGVVEMLERAAGSERRPDHWWPMRHWAARRSLDKGEPGLAYSLASAHGLKSGAAFAEAEWLSGWLALRFLDDPMKALQHFIRLNDRVSTPISLARSAYWAAEAADRLGDQQAAQEWYGRAAAHGTAFYGQQATARLGRSLDLDIDAGAAAGDAERQAFESQDLARLVRLLAAFDQRRYVKLFMTELRRQLETPAQHRLHAELAAEIGRPDQALFTAKQAYRRGFAAVDQLFPVPPDITRRLNGTESPEPALVLALIRQESAFDGRAISRAGARGLMQLMPATAHLVAKQTKLPYRRARLTEDDAYNMQLGRAYLHQQLEDFQGSAALALAAYNAGPHRVTRWIKAYGDPRRPGVDPVDWIERIPFSETRNYVQRVLEGLTVYRLALDGQRTVVPLSRKGKELGQRP